MARVQRANVFLDIPDADIEKYMAKGFSVVDAYGNVIRESVPVDLRQLRSAYEQHTKLIATLRAENAALKAQLEALKGASKPVTTPEETTDGWDNWETENTPSKKQRKTSKE